MCWNRGIILLAMLPLMLSTGNARAANVLYLGDSHSVNTSLEEAIYRGFAGRGELFVSESVCSSKPEDWVDDPSDEFPSRFSRRPGKPPESVGKRPGIPQLSEIVKEFGAAGVDIVVIEQGDNMLGRDKADITRQSIRLLQAIDTATGGRKISCYWLGPTWPSGGDEFKYLKTIDNTEKVRNGINDAIEAHKRESGHECRYVDGMELLDREWAKRQPGDGLHFELRGRAYELWGEKAFRAVKDSLK